MGVYPRSAVERMMKVQEVIMRAIEGRIQWWQAAEILGVSCRTMRRWKWRYEQHGYDGLFDRRHQRPSPKRVPLATVKEVLRLYRQQYHDYNVLHFHEKLLAEHGMELSYTWVKTALQTAGLVAKDAPRGPHRQRRERRPLPGMLVFADGSAHCWIPALAPAQQELIVFLDDANTEVYYACLVEEEGTLPMMAGLKEVIETKGLFCSFYTDRAGHFFHTPKAGGPVDKTQLTQIGRALAQLGIEHIPSYSPQARGRMERFFGSWQGRLPQELRSAGVDTTAGANRYIREVFWPWHNTHWTEPARESGSAFVPLGAVDLEAILCVQHERVVAADNTVVLGQRRLQIAPNAWRCSFARCTVKVCEQLDGTLTVRYGPHLLGRWNAAGEPLEEKKKLRKAA
jgi:transposase